MHYSFLTLIVLMGILHSQAASAVDIEFTLYNLPGDFTPITGESVSIRISPIRVDAVGNAVRDDVTGQLLDGAPAIYFNSAVTPSRAGKVNLRGVRVGSKQMVNIRLGRGGGFTQELLGIVLEEPNTYQLDIAVPKQYKQRTSACPIYSVPCIHYDYMRCVPHLRRGCRF